MPERVSVPPFCCDRLSEAVGYECEQHPNRYDCPDCLVSYLPKFREFGIIIHDGGESSIRIDYCPWCGARLPESLRDEWYDRLDALGLEHESNEIPQSLLTEKWWQVEASE